MNTICIKGKIMHIAGYSYFHPRNLLKRDMVRSHFRLFVEASYEEKRGIMHYKYFIPELNITRDVQVSAALLMEYGILNLEKYPENIIKGGMHENFIKDFIDELFNTILAEHKYIEYSYIDHAITFCIREESIIPRRSLMYRIKYYKIKENGKPTGVINWKLKQ